jgi:hypothetical protein
MGRQFRVYLLPVDVDWLLSELKQEHGLRIVARTSTGAEPIEVASATGDYCHIVRVDMFTFGQFLLAPPTYMKAPMWYSEGQDVWHVDSERSEMIEFSTCDYGAGMLLEGGFYYQKDMLSASNDAILAKSAEFVAWAERIFRTAKKRLRYLPEFEAYIGREADLWRQQGGKLVTIFQTIPKPVQSDTRQ